MIKMTTSDAAGHKKNHWYDDISINMMISSIWHFDQYGDFIDIMTFPSIWWFHQYNISINMMISSIWQHFHQYDDITNLTFPSMRSYYQYDNISISLTSYTEALLWHNDIQFLQNTHNLHPITLLKGGNTLKQKCHQDDCPGHHWRCWRQASTSPVTTRAVSLTIFPFQSLVF